MRLVLNNLWFYRWQFTYLMAAWMGACSQKQRLALLALTGLTDDNARHFFRWFQFSSMPLMPWLPPSRPFSPCFGRRFLHMGRVARWWLGRVTRILACLFFQLANPLLLLLDLLLQLRHNLLHLLDNGQQHVDQCLNPVGCRFPSLGSDAGWRLSFCHLLIALLFYPFVYPLFGGLTLYQLPI